MSRAGSCSRVRRASLDDATTSTSLNADVQALHADALPWRFKPPASETLSHSEIARLMSISAVTFFIADLDDDPAGYLLAEVCRRPETARTYAYDFLHVHHISVRPSRRNQGVGRALMDAAVALAREQCIDRLALDVWQFNSRAQAFFARYGLETYNQQMWMTVE